MPARRGGAAGCADPLQYFAWWVLGLCMSDPQYVGWLSNLDAALLDFSTNNSQCVKKLRRFISHTFRYHSPYISAENYVADYQPKK